MTKTCPVLVALEFAAGPTTVGVGDEAFAECCEPTVDYTDSFAPSCARELHDGACSAGPYLRTPKTQAAPVVAAAPLEAEFDSLDIAFDAGCAIILLSEQAEIFARAELLPAQRFPLAELLRDVGVLDPASRLLLVCARGDRSRAATQELRAHGYASAMSLRGGLQGLPAEGRYPPGWIVSHGVLYGPWSLLRLTRSPPTAANSRVV